MDYIKVQLTSFITLFCLFIIIGYDLMLLLNVRLTVFNTIYMNNNKLLR